MTYLTDLRKATISSETATTDVDTASTIPQADSIIVELTGHAYTVQGALKSRAGKPYTFSTVYNVVMNVIGRPVVVSHTAYLFEAAIRAAFYTYDECFALTICQLPVDLVMGYAGLSLPILVFVMDAVTQNPLKRLTSCVRAFESRKKREEEAKAVMAAPPARPYPDTLTLRMRQDGMMALYDSAEPSAERTIYIDYDRVMVSSRAVKHRISCAYRDFFMDSPLAIRDRQLFAKHRFRVAWDMGEPDRLEIVEPCNRLVTYLRPNPARDDPFKRLVNKHDSSDAILVAAVNRVNVPPFPEADHRVARWAALCADYRATDTALQRYGFDEKHESETQRRGNCTLVVINDGDLIPMLMHCMMKDHLGFRDDAKAGVGVNAQSYDVSWETRYSAYLKEADEPDPDAPPQLKPLHSEQVPQMFLWNGVRPVGDSSRRQKSTTGAKFELIDINALAARNWQEKRLAAQYFLASCLCGNDYVRASVPAAMPPVSAENRMPTKALLFPVRGEAAAPNLVAAIADLCGPDAPPMPEWEEQNYKGGPENGTLRAFLHDLVHDRQVPVPDLKIPALEYMGAHRGKVSRLSAFKTFMIRLKQRLHKKGGEPSDSDLLAFLDTCYRACHDWNMSIAF